MFLSNLHTHTILCDGKNTAEEMVQAAIALGFSSLGFSGHAPISYDTSYPMSEDGLKEYVREITRLKDEYKHQIKIFLGAETDVLEPFDRTGFDYIIGSVHAIYKNGTYSAVDNTKEEITTCIHRDFDDDALAMIEEYYTLVEQAANQKPDILGHFDLVCKFNSDGSLFDEEHPRYVAAAEKALRTAVENDVITEVNTGGMARGYLERPYPSVPLLKKALELGAKITLTSDSHSIDTLNYGFGETLALLKKLGFQSLYNLTEDGFGEIAL